MEEQNRNKETALGEARRPSSVEEAEAAIEAVLFAMGDSVELGRIAKAIGHDTETTRRILNHMMEKYNTKDRGIHIVELENAYQMCTKQEYYDYLVNIAMQPKKAVLTDVMMETPLNHCLQAAGHEAGDRQDPRRQERSRGQQTGGVQSGAGAWPASTRRAARLCSARPKNSCGTSASIPPTICRRSVRSRWRTSAQKWKRKCRSSWMSDPAGEKRREIPICLLRTHTTGSEEKFMNSFRQI